MLLRKKTWVGVYLLVATILSYGCAFSGSPQEIEEICLSASEMQMHAIKDNFQYSNRSADIGTAIAVRSRYFQRIDSYFVAAKIFPADGPLDGVGPGVWFMVGTQDSPENVFAINSHAVQYSTWPSGENPELLRSRLNDPDIKITMNDPDAIIALDCASNDSDKPDLINIATSTPSSHPSTSSPIFPTNTPKPTNTSAPSITPTNTTIPDLLATPFTSGGPILVNNWLIEINRIEFLDELTFYDRVRRNEKGRFVVLLLSVSNVGQNKDDFVGTHGYLDIFDAESNVYEENFEASFEAQVMFDQDIGVGLDIEPGETRNYMVVYDISDQSDYYIFSPGYLVEKISGNLELIFP